MVKARFLVEKAKKQNKTDQEIQRIKKLLTMTEEDLEMKVEAWKEEQIFMFLLVLESETKTGRKIVVKITRTLRSVACDEKLQGACV